MARKRKPLPTRYPKAAAAAYARSIVEMVKRMHAIYYAAFQEAIKPEAKAYRPDSFRFDGPLDLIIAALQQAKKAATFVFNPRQLRAVARQFVNQVELFSRNNIGEQVKKIRGIDPTIGERWIADFVSASVEENVSYITTIPEQYHDRITGVVLQGVKNGRSIPEMAAEIRKVYKVTENRARFIARDQAGSLTGQLTARRHQAAGVTRFIWRTSEDERVRAEHDAFDGREYSYAEGAGPRKLLPGRDYNCRCTAEPIFD